MSKNLYVGVNNVARKGSKVYVGVNGTARKVKKIYVGVNNVARECYSALPKIVTFNGGTDAEIVAMVEAADNGLINLADYWSVGDERNITTSYISSQYNMEYEPSQTLKFVLMDTNKKTLVTPTPSGRTTCSFILGVKDCMSNKGKIQPVASSQTGENIGGWDACDRRKWCNDSFYYAIPSTIRPIFKQFYNATSIGNSSSTIKNSADYFALASEIEIVCNQVYSKSGEGSPIARYQTVANRWKYISGTEVNHWERSPFGNGSREYCAINTNHNNGGANAAGAFTQYGISPYGVI